MSIKGNLKILLVFLVSGCLQSFANEAENKLKILNSEADIVVDGHLYPPDDRETNLCHIIDCDEEEAIARNESQIELNSDYHDYNWGAGDQDMNLAYANKENINNMSNVDVGDFVVEKDDDFVKDDLYLDENDSKADEEFSEQNLHAKADLNNNNFDDQLAENVRKS